MDVENGADARYAGSVIASWAARYVAPPVEEPTQAIAERERPAPVVGSLAVNGMVMRSSGNNTSWINGSRVDPRRTTREGLVLEAGPRGMRITLPSGVDTIELAPGQKIDVLTGKVLED